MPEIYVSNNTNSNITALENTVRQAIAESLRCEGILFDCELSVTFVSPDEIKALNNEYRSIDDVTDVLSFPLLSDKAEVLKLNSQKNAQPVAMGDIVICLDRAAEQAKAYGHDIVREIGFLTAHSMLHLLGYDHMTAEDETEMFGKQEEILSNINLTR